MSQWAPLARKLTWVTTKYYSLTRWNDTTNRARFFFDSWASCATAVLGDVDCNSVTSVWIRTSFSALAVSQIMRCIKARYLLTYLLTSLFQRCFSLLLLLVRQRSVSLRSIRGNGWNNSDSSCLDWHDRPQSSTLLTIIGQRRRSTSCRLWACDVTRLVWRLTKMAFVSRCFRHSIAD